MELEPWVKNLVEVGSELGKIDGLKATKTIEEHLDRNGTLWQRAQLGHGFPIPGNGQGFPAATRSITSPPWFLSSRIVTLAIEQMYHA